MRFLRTILLLVILAIVGVVGYNYWSGRGLTLGSAPSLSGVDTERAKERGAEFASKAAEKAGEAATKLEAAMAEGALTAKIKSKMALDDSVKARSINVTTSGSVVTLTGTVASAEEHERAVSLARETDGVTQVVDRLEVKKP